ncbi:MAG: hypothetical protein ACRDPY_15255 [Streptosporangiaceae bacterium]
MSARPELFIDGERYEPEDLHFETPRLIYTVRFPGPARRAVGPAGFAVTITGRGDLPSWVDAAEHDVLIRAPQAQLPVRVKLAEVDRDGDRWCVFGCLTESVTVPTWEEIP